MNSFNDVWESVCDFCRNETAEVAFNCWIKTLTPVKLSGDTVTVSARSSYQKGIVESHYSDLLTRAFTDTFGFPVKVQFVSEDDQAIKRSEPSRDGMNTSYTFDNFVVGPSNRFAHAAAVAVAKNPGNSYNPLFIYGNPGLGKTHLLNAIRNEIKSSFPEMNIVYTQGEAFANEIIEAIHNVRTPAFREKYRNTDVLFVDDIQFIAGMESTQTEFFNTFNTLYENNKQIILTSDRPPKEIKSLDERMSQRFEMGLLADIQKPDFETRVAIIRRKAEQLGFELPDGVIQCIANQIKTNIRQIEGVVNKLLAYSRLTNEKPTITNTTNLINEIRKDQLPDPITIDKIISIVASTYDVSPSDICSNKQNMEVANARHIAIYLSREITGLPLKTIGKSFGRNHSTVSASINKIEREIRKNSRMKATINDIIKNIKSS